MDLIEKISVLGKDGGYKTAPAHILQNDVSPERVLKFIELYRKHGAYKSAPASGLGDRKIANYFTSNS
jgi:hypothetical protein